MKVKFGIGCLSFACAGALFCAVAWSQEEGKEQEKAADPKAVMMEMMEKMGAAPGEHHKKLEPFVGDWKLAVKYRMEPEGEWQESMSESEIEWMFDGRYIKEEVEGEMMEDMKFKGLGITGYDNLKNKYVSVWLDNMGTSLMTSEGSCDESCKVFTFTGEHIDPMTGKTQKDRTVLRILNNDKHVMEMYMTGPDGKEFKSMEIVSTRA